MFILGAKEIVTLLFAMWGSIIDYITSRRPTTDLHSTNVFEFCRISNNLVKISQLTCIGLGCNLPFWSFGSFYFLNSLGSRAALPSGDGLGEKSTWKVVPSPTPTCLPAPLTQCPSASSLFPSSLLYFLSLVDLQFYLFLMLLFDSSCLFS